MKLDSYHYHEFTDRCYIIIDMMEKLLEDHPVCQEHKELRELVEESSSILIGAYQYSVGLEE